MLFTDCKGKQFTRDQVYQRMLTRSQTLRNCGYTVVEFWEHEAHAGYAEYDPDHLSKARVSPKKNETYPHAIVYDFEAYQDKTKAFQPTKDLKYESEHVPVSVSIADTLNREPEYICSKNPEKLIQKFYEALEHRSAAIRVEVCAKYMPLDFEGVSKPRQKAIQQWCEQVPVVGFNSGHYDLYLIRKYFVFPLGQEAGVFAGVENCCIMFINTPHCKFLDVMNYVSPGTSYDKWVKTYGATQTKSWLPYEWFDSADKLDYKGLPP